MSPSDRAGSDLDALLASPTPTPTPTPTAGQGEERGERQPKAPRGRLEAWLRGGGEVRIDELTHDAGPGGVEGGAPGASGDPGSGADGVLRTVSIDAVEPNTYQPRRHFDEESLGALADSIASLGVLQPVLVRSLDGERFELIAGERRWRAARLAGMRTIPVLVRPADDQGALEQAIVENLHRQDLNPLEEAAAYQELADEFGLTQDAVAQRVGKSRSAVANALRLLQLPGAVQRLVVDGRVSAGHARAVLSVGDAEAQRRLTQRIIDEDLSVRQTEEAVRQMGEEPSGRGAAGEGRTGKSVGALEVQLVLEERLATRVEVQEAGRGGRLVIRFADGDDLERLVGLMLATEADPGLS